MADFGDFIDFLTSINPVLTHLQYINLEQLVKVSTGTAYELHYREGLAFAAICLHGGAGVDKHGGD